MMTDYDKLRYSTEEMYELGTEGSNKEHSTYDFSFISNDDYYKGFFNTIQNIIYKKCVSIRFCNDFERSLERSLVFQANKTEDSQNNENIDQDLKIYQNSIRFKKPGYSNYLGKIIAKTLPRTKLCETLEFDQIPFSSESFRLITNAIKKTRVLKSITFANLIVEDKDFEYFLENVSPYRLDKIAFINCHITGDTYDALKEFVNRKPKVQNQDYQLKFAKLILRGNGIKYNRKTGEIKRRIEPEDSIKEKDIVVFNVNWIEEDPDENEESAQKRLMLRNIRDVVYTVKPATPSNNLRKQNESLKRELNELITAIRAVKYSDDVYFVGDNAEACIKRIRKAENVIQVFESKHGELIL